MIEKGKEIGKNIEISIQIVSITNALLRSEILIEQLKKQNSLILGGLSKISSMNEKEFNDVFGDEDGDK